MGIITRHSLISLVACLIQNAVSAQLIIQPGTSLGFSNDKPEIVIQAAGNITTNNVTDFSSANLHLILTADLTISDNLIASQLNASSGNTTVTGDLFITQDLKFSGGILTPEATIKITFTGDGRSVTGGSTTSYVNGIFYQIGGGYRFYPIGNRSTYSPAIFENIASTKETGVEVVSTDAALTIDDPTVIASIDPAHHWLISTDDPTTINSRVALGLAGITQASGEETLAVVQAEAPGSIADNLGGFSIDETQVTSRTPVTKPLLSIGTLPKVIVKVRDLITPFDGADNNSLYIERIDAFNFNTVTLMDRWGVVVKRWENFTNEVEYDFTQLGPGNYIVLVECRDTADAPPVEKISQMVTVLKTN